MINLNHNTKRGINSTFSSSQDATSISQCLPLDPINLGNQKYNRSTELKRVLTAPVGNNLESYSEELKNFKESVQDTTKKARCRAKVLEHSISKLEEFRVVKRQRTDPLSNGRSCSGYSSMDNNNNKISSNKNIIGLGPKSRVRTSMLDAWAEGRAITRQQQVLVVKNRENITNKDDVEMEENFPEKLPNVGGSDGIGWEKKMRRKRSVGGVYNNSNSNSNNNTNICNNINDNNNNNSSSNINNSNNKRAANGNREIKRATLVKPSGDSELHEKA